MPESVKLTRDHCQAIWDTLDQLSGCSPENVFAWDGTDDPTDATMQAWAIIFKACGKRIPKELEDFQPDLDEAAS